MKSNSTLNEAISASVEKSLTELKKKTNLEKVKAVKSSGKSKKDEATKKSENVTKVTKSKKVSKVEKEVDHINKNQLLESVISKREVKYIYPEDCTDTLTRKSFRQKVRNKLHTLERNLFRIKDQSSKEYKEAKVAYENYLNQVCKPNIAV